MLSLAEIPRGGRTRMSRRWMCTTYYSCFHPYVVKDFPEIEIKHSDPVRTLTS